MGIYLSMENDVELEETLVLLFNDSNNKSLKENNVVVDNEIIGKDEKELESQ
jgi:hypothetical protein